MQWGRDSAQFRPQQGQMGIYSQGTGVESVDGKLQVLVYSGCCNTTDWVAYKQQKFSVLEAGRPKSGCRVRHFFSRLQTSPCFLTWRIGLGNCESFLGTNPIHESFTLIPNHLPKAPIYWVGQKVHMGFFHKVKDIFYFHQ